jgi:hypothetical protein
MLICILQSMMINFVIWNLYVVTCFCLCAPQYDMSQISHHTYLHVWLIEIINCRYFFLRISSTSHYIEKYNTQNDFNIPKYEKAKCKSNGFAIVEYSFCYQNHKRKKIQTIMWREAAFTWIKFPNNYVFIVFLRFKLPFCFCYEIYILFHLLYTFINQKHYLYTEVVIYLSGYG